MQSLSTTILFVATCSLLAACSTGTDQREDIKVNSAKSTFGKASVPVKKMSEKLGGKTCLDLEKLIKNNARAETKNRALQINHSELAWLNTQDALEAISDSSARSKSSIPSIGTVFETNELFAGVSLLEADRQLLISEFFKTQLIMEIQSQSDCEEIRLVGGNKAVILQATDKSLLLRHRDSVYISIDLIFTKDRGGILRIRKAEMANIKVCGSSKEESGVILSEFLMNPTAPNPETFLLQPNFLKQINELSLATEAIEETSELQKLSARDQPKRGRMVSMNVEELIHLPMKVVGNLPEADPAKKQKFAKYCEQ